MKWEAFAMPARKSSFRYSGGEVEASVVGPHPAAVQLVCDPDGALLTFFLTPDQANELSAKLADAAAAARAMPVEERVYEVGKTKAEVEQGALKKAGAR